MGTDDDREVGVQSSAARSDDSSVTNFSRSRRSGPTFAGDNAVERLFAEAAGANSAAESADLRRRFGGRS
jgi:hypothetical protein